MKVCILGKLSPQEASKKEGKEEKRKKGEEGRVTFMRTWSKEGYEPVPSALDGERGGGK